MDVQQIIQEWEIARSLEAKEELRKKLAVYVNDLLLDNFEKLVQVLYQIDVSEQELKMTLMENKEKDAGQLIAEMMIKRQEEKIAVRQSFPPAKDISDDERW